jgi:hypothetical protein
MLDSNTAGARLAHPLAADKALGADFTEKRLDLAYRLMQINLALCKTPSMAVDDNCAGTA